MFFSNIISLNKLFDHKDFFKEFISLLLSALAFLVHVLQFHCQISIVDWIYDLG